MQSGLVVSHTATQLPIHCSCGIVHCFFSGIVLDGAIVRVWVLIPDYPILPQMAPPSDVDSSHSTCVEHWNSDCRWRCTTPAAPAPLSRAGTGGAGADLSALELQKRWPPFHVRHVGPRPVMWKFQRLEQSHQSHLASHRKTRFKKLSHFGICSISIFQWKNGYM